MSETSYTMRLRPRPKSLENSNPIESRPAATKTQKTRSTRAALGDISNRRTRRTSSKAVASKDVSTKGKRVTQRQQLVVLDEDDQPVTKPRRLSARLSALRNREEAIKNSKTKESTEEETKEKKHEQKKRRRASDLKVSSKQPAAKRVRATTRGSTKTSSKPEEEKSSVDLLLEKQEREEKLCLIHPNFRLERLSFDGKNLTTGIANVDKASRDNVLLAAPYVADMFQHLFRQEGRSRPRMYMEDQTDINAKMRAILVDWLIEVHTKFRLVPETLYLCINILDRYCKLVQIRRSKLQLVGVTALLIACKYEEIYPPEVRDCVFITDRAYTSSEVLDMEQDIVHRLGFKITVPTAYPFLQRFLNMIKASTLTKHAASYYTERTLQEHDMLFYKPSLICVAAVILAVNNADLSQQDEDSDGFEVGEGPGMPPILLEYTGYSRYDIIDCATHIAKKVSEEPVTASNRELIAVKRKYDSKKYLNVSTSVDLPSVHQIQIDM